MRYQIPQTLCALWRLFLSRTGHPIQWVLHTRLARGFTKDVVKVFEQQVDRQRVRCFLDSSQLKIDVSGTYVQYLLWWEVIVRDQSIDKYNTFRSCGWSVQDPRDTIGPAGLPFSPDLISFWWTAVSLLLLCKSYCMFSDNSNATTCNSSEETVFI